MQLLIHETRHSGQFQQAFQSDDVLARGFRAAFKAQKQLQGKLSFCDFLTLHNEHEAFQFGNYVVGALTNWRVDDPGMGVFSSQYDAHGRLKLNLLALSRQVGPAKLLTAFNEREREQFLLLGGSR